MLNLNPNNKKERLNNGSINLIPSPSESPVDNKISLCDAIKSALCCVTPHIENGKIIRNCLCCTTWTVLTLGGATGVAATAHAIKATEILGACTVVSSVCAFGVCFAVKR